MIDDDIKSVGCRVYY